MQTHTDQIWSSEFKEKHIVSQLNTALAATGRRPGPVDSFRNFGYPEIFQGPVYCRLVDSVFLDNPEAWNQGIIITDNVVLRDITSELITVLPEFWHIWSFDPKYIDRPAQIMFNCLMNRISGDRSIVFYELIRRGLLDQGIVSFNCFRPGDQTDNSGANYDWQYQEAELDRYAIEHVQGKNIIPYNTICDRELEQCIIDSQVSVVLETYISDSHIVYSEKIFRALQLPRPWLLYCSPLSIKNLRNYGFDVLDDYVDHEYDNILPHHPRLLKILDQLETFKNKHYTDIDYARFNQAAEHNKNLLKQFEKNWPTRLQQVLDRISQL